MLFKTSIGLALAGLVLAVLAALPASAAGNRINVRDDYFQPRAKTVTKGTRLVWVNVGSSPHTVTTSGWSQTLNPGQRYARVVKRGFRYHCAFHSGMTGRVAIG
jgi:plastocyanin